jgi:hypothetical protein
MSSVIIRELYSDILHINNNNPMACIQYIIHDNKYIDVFFNTFFDDIECISFNNIIYLSTYNIDKVIDSIHTAIINKYCPFLTYFKDFIKDDAWHLQETKKYNGIIEKIKETYKFIIS